MKIEINGIEYEAFLKCVANEYNCSVKMVGRLELDIKSIKDGQVPYVDSTISKAILANKRELIREFSERVVDKAYWPSLRNKNNIFPVDSGVYLPNILLYADIVTKDPGYFYTDFKALILELEKDPSYGWQIFKFPLYSNNTYSGSVRPSRVWGLVPPLMVGHMLLPGMVGDKHKNFIRSYGIPKSIPLEDQREIRQAIGI
jgi:hypothetical protein